MNQFPLDIYNLGQLYILNEIDGFVQFRFNESSLIAHCDDTQLSSLPFILGGGFSHCQIEASA
jgi:hypothetical protein